MNTRILSEELAQNINKTFGSPAFVYQSEILKNSALDALSFPNAFGLTVRYAMKASPNAAILQLFNKLGLHIDASSGYEVKRAIKSGIPAENISLSTQELPGDFKDLLEQGIKINACSLTQIKLIGEALPGIEMGIRINPGFGSGGTTKTNVGGPSSSFGIWHESIPEVQSLIEKHQLKVVRIHTHIGSGSDPEVWKKASILSLDNVRKFPNVHTLNLGGGFKVARIEGEKTCDMQEVGSTVKNAFIDFEKETQRKLHLEVEPGTFLVANSCAVLSTVQDIIHTGDDGYKFLKLDCGMTEILRPSLYGSQHPIEIVTAKDTSEKEAYVIVGHCCESGDLLTPAPDQPDVINTRTLPKSEIGDLCIIGGAGAYCSAMSSKNYNSFPEAVEVMVDRDGNTHVIRQRQTLEQVLQNEVSIDLSTIG